MKIGILYERRPNEKRVAASVESIKKLTQLGFDVCIEKSAGQRAGISDQDFQTAGATIAQTPQETCEGRDLIIKIQRPMDLNEGHDELSILPKNSFLLCHMDAKKHKEFVRELSARGIHAFALEMMPRITRAQSMDILSSQANIAGYKAVLDALEHYGRAMPMMMTPAGTVPPARVFIMGVGVAGLQAIATARRLGAIVSASDVRPATKEQVESLGAKFIAVEDEEFLQAQTSAGYAKEMSQGYQKKQAELIAKTVSNQDIIITTALIPGKPAPRLISSKMIETMKEGSVLIDMAVEAGGNIEGAIAERIIRHGPAKIIGHSNIPARIPRTASELFARNILNFLTPLYDQEKATLKLNFEDEIIKHTLLTHEGKILHPDFIQSDQTAKITEPKAHPIDETSLQEQTTNHNP